MLDQSAEQFKNEVLLLYLDRTFTYKQFNDTVNQYVNYFGSLHWKKGDFAMVMLENRPEFLMIVMALNKLGVIAALINTNQRDGVLLHSLSIVEPVGYIIGEECMAQVAGIPGKDGATWLFVKDTGQLEEEIPNRFVDLGIKIQDEDTVNAYEHVLGDIQLGDACFLVYTSGTTGMPKASIMSNQRYVKACAGVGCLAVNISRHDVVYITLPLFHNSGITVGWGPTMMMGGCVALRRKFSASNFWKDCIRYKVTTVVYIGELCRYLMNQPESELDQMHQVYKVIGNGMRDEIWKPFKHRFNIEEVYEFYSASECNIAFVNLFNLDNVVGLCFVPFAIVECDIESGNPIRNEKGTLIRVAKGRSGLLLGKITKLTPFDGYMDDNASDAKVIRNAFKDGDAWVNTGDLMLNVGYMHAKFVDRLGDTFRWKGENIATTQVEAILNEYPGIRESIVYGVEIPKHEGRCGMALIAMKKNQSLNITALLTYLRSKLPAPAVPIFLRIDQQVSVTQTFKHQKALLKKEGYAFHIDREVYYCSSKQNEYTRLTTEKYRQMRQHEISF